MFISTRVSWFVSLFDLFANNFFLLVHHPNLRSEYFKLDETTSFSILPCTSRLKLLCIAVFWTSWWIQLQLSRILLIVFIKIYLLSDSRKQDCVSLTLLSCRRCMHGIWLEKQLFIFASRSANSLSLDNVVILIFSQKEEKFTRVYFLETQVTLHTLEFWRQIRHTVVSSSPIKYILFIISKTNSPLEGPIAISKKDSNRRA